MTGNLPADSRPWARRRDEGLSNATMRHTIGVVTRRFQLAQGAVFAGFPEGEVARKRAVVDKRAAIRDLDALLQQFRSQVESHGGKTYLASSREDALNRVKAIASSANVRRIVKSKSMVTEELQVNRALQDAAVDVIETDLGEYIIQRAGETPSHILAPAAHKNRSEIKALFNEDADLSHLDRPEGDDAEMLTRYARRRLRQEFLSADMGITGGNFLVAESGTVVLITNEGNADLVVSLPRVLVSIVGIEKVIRGWDELSDMIQQPAMNGVGQRLSSYTTFITGLGCTSAEGPQEWHVILLDNGRSGLRNTPFEDVLSCIRCGACLNVCPVFRQVGGHAYGSVYSGPIGIVETPLLTDLKVLPELPTVACTLCYACQDACPMDIALPQHIIQLRAEKVHRGMDSAAHRATYRWWGRFWATAQGYRRSVRMARWGQRFYLREGLLKNAPGLPQGWFQTRNMPPVARETFHEWWARERGSRG